MWVNRLRFIDPHRFAWEAFAFKLDTHAAFHYILPTCIKNLIDKTGGNEYA